MNGTYHAILHKQMQISGKCQLLLSHGKAIVKESCSVESSLFPWQMPDGKLLEVATINRWCMYKCIEAAKQHITKWIESWRSMTAIAQIHQSCIHAETKNWNSYQVKFLVGQNKGWIKVRVRIFWVSVSAKMLIFFSYWNQLSNETEQENLVCKESIHTQTDIISE